MKQQKIKLFELALLPTNLDNKNWNTAIERFHSTLGVDNLDTSEKQGRSLIAGKYIVAMHWVVRRKLCPKYKVPVPRRVMVASEPMGDWLRSILELCIQCHAFPFSDSKQYENAWEWFVSVVLELDAIEEQEILKGVPKSHTVNKLRREIEAIRKGENPYSPVDHPHMYRLMNNALIRAAYNPDFKTEFLKGRANVQATQNKGFCKASTDWVREQESPRWSALLVRGDKLLQQSGRGKSLHQVVLFNSVQKIKPRILAP